MKTVDFWPILWISNFEHKVVIMNDSCAKRLIFTYFSILRVLSPKIKDNTPTLLKCRISITKNASNRSFWSAILKNLAKWELNEESENDSNGEAGSPLPGGSCTTAGTGVVLETLSGFVPEHNHHPILNNPTRSREKITFCIYSSKPCAPAILNKKLKKI